MTAHDAPKGILRKPMRLQLRKRKVLKQSPLHMRPNANFKTVKSINEVTI